MIKNILSLEINFSESVDEISFANSSARASFPDPDVP